jgi:hypothetical protein
MVIDYEDQSYEIDFEDITVRQAIVIHRETGFTMAGFHEALTKAITGDQESYLDILSIICWLMTGGSQIFARVDCKVLKLTAALGNAIKEQNETRLRIQRSKHAGKTELEYWQERSEIAAELPFADQIEIKKYFESYGKSQKWFDEWYTKNISELRSQWLWDFGDVVGMSAHDVDALRVGDFFCYCNCLQEHRRNEERQAREARDQQNNQTVQR